MRSRVLHFYLERESEFTRIWSEAESCCSFANRQRNDLFAEMHRECLNRDPVPSFAKEFKAKRTLAAT